MSARGGSAYGGPMDTATVQTYLNRIGLPHDLSPTVASLRRLHEAHLYAVPFENLSIHLGEPIELDVGLLVDKLVHQRRGGFCYELNGAFAELLEALGFGVERLGARVVSDGRPGSPFDHLALRVRAEDHTVPWLADVGFGRSFLQPLRLDDPTPQTDPHGTFTITPAADGDVDLFHDGLWSYRLERRARDLADFGPTCWYMQTSPRSPFTRGPTCSLPRRDGSRVTLADHALIETAADGTRTETELRDDAVLAAYRTHFGIELDQVPTAPPA